MKLVRCNHEDAGSVRVAGINYFQISAARCPTYCDAGNVPSRTIFSGIRQDFLHFLLHDIVIMNMRLTRCRINIVADIHRREYSSRKTRIREQGFLRLFQRGQRLLSSDRREVLQEVGKRVARFQVIHQRLKRNASPDKYRSAAQNLRIAMDDGFHGARLRLPVHYSSIQTQRLQHLRSIGASAVRRRSGSHPSSDTETSSCTSGSARGVGWKAGSVCGERQLSTMAIFWAQEMVQYGAQDFSV